MNRANLGFVALNLAIALSWSNAWSQDDFETGGKGTDGTVTSKAIDRRILELRQELGRRQDLVDSQAAATLTVRALVEILKSDKRDDVRETVLRHRAIERMSHFPYVEDAVVTLVKNIDYGGEGITRDWPLASYPAAVALTRIGTPARRYILASLGTQQSDLRLHLMAYVLVELDAGGQSLDSDREVTLYRLTRELEAFQRGDLANGQEVRSQNLQRIITLLKEPGFRGKPFPRQTRNQQNAESSDTGGNLIDEFLKEHIGQPR